MKTKNILLAIALGSGALTFSSCSDYLDVDRYFNDRMTEEKLFEDKKYTEQWLAGVYSHLRAWNEDICSKGNTPHNFSDDMYFGDRSGLYRTLKYGLYNENTFQNSWRDCYVAIRDASTFIRNVYRNKDLNEQEIADQRGQARFLRAYYYWLLLRKYGPIPLVPNNGEMDYSDSYEDLALPRNSYDECADYIAEELRVAAGELAVDRTSTEIARATRGAALALRAKVLLYAASPLANGNTEMADLTDDTGRQLIAQEYDESKWARAAAAALDVMNLGKYKIYVADRRYNNDGGEAYPMTIMPPETEENKEYATNDWPLGWQNIDPFESYRSLFNGDLIASNNPELIFTRGVNTRQAPANTMVEDIEVMVQHQMPFQMQGYNCHGMTLKQCDAYYTNKGEDIPGKDDYLGRGDGSTRRTGFVTQDTEEQYKPLKKDVSLQYAEREPRFYASVAYNGCVWEMSTSYDDYNRFYRAWYYHDSNDGKVAQTGDLYLRTGIGVKKFYNPQDSYMNGGRIIPKLDTAIRYAEILLIYAEALNELNGVYEIASWDGSQNYTIKRDKEEMAKGIEPIRIRAGLPNYSDDVYNSQDEFRKKLKRERQIELFAEGHRYYDLRRWKDAPEEEATMTYGCNINISSSESNRELYYIPTVVPSLPAVFTKKMYFWPISHDELKRNARLTQNPGWTYYD